MTTTQAINEYASHSSEGTPLAAKSLLHLGDRAAIDQALSRLVKRGQLLRVGRGIYTRPVETRVGQRAPAPEKFMQAWSAHTGETVAPSGAAAANLLGLTTQNPSTLVYLTSGPSRTLSLGGQRIELRHARNWLLQAPASKSGHAIRALAWMGKENAAQAAREVLNALNGTERAEVLSLRSRLPQWIAKEVSAIAHT